MKYTVFSLLMCCIALCSCEKHTVTYTYPEGPQAPEDAATLLISSKNKIYVSEDEHTGSATFRSRGGELVLNVSTNQESCRSQYRTGSASCCDYFTSWRREGCPSGYGYGQHCSKCFWFIGNWLCARYGPFAGSWQYYRGICDRLWYR